MDNVRTINTRIGGSYFLLTCGSDLFIEFSVPVHWTTLCSAYCIDLSFHYFLQQIRVNKLDKIVITSLTEVMS